jgi:hypothetical protein
VLYLEVVRAEFSQREGPATVGHLGLICREEGEYLTIPTNRPFVDAWQIFFKALHPQLVQHDLRQLGSEFPFRGGKYLHIRGENCRRIRIRIGERENFAPGHFPISTGRSGTRPRVRIVKKIADDYAKTATI